MVAAGVVVDAFGDGVDGNDVAREFPQRVAGKAAVEFGGVMDEDPRDLVEVLTFADPYHRSIPLHTTDDCSWFLGFCRELERRFEFGCR